MSVSMLGPAASGIANGSDLHRAALAQLPLGLEFPASLADRVWYDSRTGTLVVRGFMSKALFDRLQLLHGDLAYQRALQQLFQAGSTPRRAGRVWPVRRWLPIAVATAGMVLIAMLVSFWTF